ncbi:MAG TPA: ABC transporter ATP-binding protein [Clostridia bacterium]|nr:ABC transporter ATP-binding protein [Clostridia bacterium]
MDAVVELSNIHKIYRAGRVEVHALRGVTLTVKAGDFVCIMGPSGSGKSTLLNVIGCLDHPSSGKYLLDGRDVLALSDGELAQVRNRTLGFIFQGFHLLPRLSVRQNVELPLIYRGIGPRERRARAEKALEAVGLGAEANRFPSELSGGQQQRVAVARALVAEPLIVLADEPTGNLDSRTGEEILALFQSLNDEMGITVVMVTHDHVMAQHGKRIVDLRDGVVISDKPVERRLLAKGILEQGVKIAG